MVSDRQVSYMHLVDEANALRARGKEKRKAVEEISLKRNSEKIKKEYANVLLYYNVS